MDILLLKLRPESPLDRGDGGRPNMLFTRRHVIYSPSATPELGETPIRSSYQELSPCPKLFSDNSLKMITLL